MHYVFAQGSATVGTYKSAGLPNITGTATRATSDVWYGEGAIIELGQAGTGFAGGTFHFGSLGFNASKSNSIYGNSTTVQPPALTLLPCIKY